MINWQDSSPEFKDFSEFLTGFWISENFTKETAKEWLKVGIDEYNLAFYLQDVNQLTPLKYKELPGNQKEELKEKCNKWTKQFDLCIKCHKRMLKKEVYFKQELLPYFPGKFLVLCSENCKANHEFMKWIFTEDNFKSYLRKQAKKGWFTKSNKGISYESRSGVFSYKINDYSLGLKKVLVDPSITIDTYIIKAQGLDQMAELNRQGNQIALNSLSSNYSYNYYSYGNPQSAYTTSLLNQVNTYREDVNFTLSADDSDWIVQNALVNQAAQIAENIALWSNQIYREMFEITQTSQSNSRETVDSLINLLNQYQTLLELDQQPEEQTSTSVNSKIEEEVQSETSYFKTITNRLTSIYQEFTKEVVSPETNIKLTTSSESTSMIGSFPSQFQIQAEELIAFKQSDEQIESLTNNLENKLNISTSSNIELEKKITLKEKELVRKEKVFNIYVEKSNEEGIERLEKEITILETEIADLKAQLTSSETNSFQLQD